MAEARPSAGGHDIGTWCWHQRQSAPCRVVDRQDVGRGDLPRLAAGKDAVVRARSTELSAGEREPSVDHILHTAAAAKLLDAGGQPAPRADPVFGRSLCRTSSTR